MITIETINEIVKGRLTKLSISKVDTWIDKNHQEGIEFQAGKLKSFWAKDGERKYGEPASEQIQSILKAILSFESDTKNEKDELPASKEVQRTECVDVILPDTFTPSILEKWEKMKTVERMMMFQHTPKDRICERPGPGPGGKTLKYVEGNYMIREANAAFLFSWNFEIKQLQIGEKAVAVLGKLSVEIDGKTISRDCVGYEDINQHMNAQLAIKSATTDCIKKGLSLFGFNNDVYSGEC